MSGHVEVDAPGPATDHRAALLGTNVKKPLFSNQLYLAITLIMAAFIVFEVGLNLLLRAENDRLANLAAEECLKPASVPDLREFQAFYFEPGSPGFSTMVTQRVRTAQPR